MADAADVTKVVTKINGSIEVYTPHTKKDIQVLRCIETFIYTVFVLI